MLSKRTVFFLLCTAALLAGVLSLHPQVSYAATTESLTLKLEMANFRLARQGDGSTLIIAEGFNQYAEPGNPLLPGKIIKAALPPDVDLASVRIDVSPVAYEIVSGEHTFPAAGPIVTWLDGKEVVDWGPHAATIQDGRNTAVYESDAWFPENLVVLLDTPQMRKWTFARLQFTPVEFHPPSGEIRINTAVNVSLTYQRQPASSLTLNQALADRAFDQQAAKFFINMAEAQSWYGSSDINAMTDEKPGLAIITTNEIVAGSTSLEDFITHKDALGYRVHLVTEDDYTGLTGQAPNETADKIRQWLINHYLADNITDVLLIGNPEPLGDVPMKKCWAREYFMVPTDYYYADLSGNWNLDGDIYFCEFEGDAGPGGVDFAADVYVGRIPVYVQQEDWKNKLDKILTKSIHYDNEKDTSWRYSALLAMTFSDSNTDGAYLTESMIHDFLPLNNVKPMTLYQQAPDSYCDSIFPSDERLSHHTAGHVWKDNPFGLVAWWGHGNPSGVVLGCGEGTLFNILDPPLLDDTHPAFVFQGSCSNGQPEIDNNLGTELLRNGAVGTISASRVSYYTPGIWFQKSIPDTPAVGYYFLEGLVQAKQSGQAFYQPSINLAPEGPHWWHNMFTYNLYGDPTVRMLKPARMSVDPAEISVTLEEGALSTHTMEIHNDGEAPLHYQIKETEPAYQVAVYDHPDTGDISYWTGDNTNAWLYFRDLLVQDPENRFEVGVIRHLNPETLSNYNRLLLPDNGIPDIDLEAVADWFKPGKQIIVVDDAVSYAAYAGWLWPDHTGSHGRDILWDGYSSSLGQEIIAHHKVTEDYLPGIKIASMTWNARLFRSKLAEDTLALAADFENPEMATIAVRDVPNKGLITFLGPFEMPLHSWQIDQQARIIRDGVEGSRDISWLEASPSAGTVEPAATESVTVSIHGPDPDTIGGLKAVGALTVSGNGQEDLLVRVPVHVTVAQYQHRLIALDGSETGPPGEVIFHTLRIYNQGNVSDSYQLSTSGNWWAGFESDVLGPIYDGGELTFWVSVKIPPDALAGESDKTEITVVSKGNGANSSIVLSTTVEPVYAAEISPLEAQMSGVPGAVLISSLHIKNTGNIRDTYDLVLQSDWTVNAPQHVGPLLPGEETAVEVQVTLPKSAPPGTSDEMVLTLHSTGDPALSLSANWICRVHWLQLFLPFVIQSS